MTAPDSQNPLIDYAGLPPFAQIKPHHVEPAINELVADIRADIEALTCSQAGFTWNNFVEPLQQAFDRLDRAWAPVRHLNAVTDDAELRTAHNACLPTISRLHSEIGQHRGLYAGYRAIANGSQYDALDTTQRKAVDDALRDFHLGGVDLPETDRERFTALEAELSELESRFEDNVLDATQAWQKPIDDVSVLQGLGDDALALAQTAAERQGLPGWLLTLEFPLVHAVLTTAENRDLRREVYTAWTTRASEHDPDKAQWDNSPIMERIIALRQEKATLLGYADYAELTLQTRMVRNTAEAHAFLENLLDRSLPIAREEIATLRDFARDTLGIDTLESWDTAFASEQLRQTRFELSDETLKPYFPAPRVIDGLFSVVSRLFGLAIEQRKGIDTWDENVAFYAIKDANGDERGGFYLDIYSRSGKRDGAWMDGCSDRIWRDGVLRTPIAFVTCNLMPPIGDRPAQFTHDDVITLFHEFGHALHHLLTQIDVPDLAGINGVEWDAVELPSQLLENWCWERESLDLIACHVDDASPLPDALLERLQASRNFQAALGLLRQIEFALFDLRLHAECTNPSINDIQSLLGDVRDHVAVIKPPAFNRFAHGFMHIFAGGYAAGYYSYQWAEVLSADAFSLFRTAGVLDAATGAAFREAVLERGGARPALESFEAFRGRAPDPEALLRQSGLVA